ncbi:hypothetical protein ACFOGJ_17545 [Marinibaculum pumilum]|uniref:Ig-like domain-containing protein n=1 Tax=Marinibaculum pumilum TaxID=1766165 RepID=A0ABV7L3C1_9PROT
MFRPSPSPVARSRSPAWLRRLAPGILLVVATALPAAAEEQADLRGELAIMNSTPGNALLEMRCHSDSNRRIAGISVPARGSKQTNFSGSCDAYYAYGEASGAGDSFTYTCRASVATKRRAHAVMIVRPNMPCEITQY